MTLSNYEIMRNQMRGKFLEYNQEKMIRKFSLDCDEDYIYIDFVRRNYRINRKNGVVEWSADDFHSVTEAGYEESMTIYDVLCCSKDDCRLAGTFCPIHMLKGIAQSAVPGGSMIQKAADKFHGHTEDLRYACDKLGEPIRLGGDVAALLHPFSFLPVTIQYWDADEDFPPNLKFMFDENILAYMHYETVHYMMGHIVKRLEEVMDGILDEVSEQCS